jgi:hypothetical protein
MRLRWYHQRFSIVNSEPASQRREHAVVTGAGRTMAPSLAIADRLERRLLGLARNRSNASLRVRFLPEISQEGGQGPRRIEIARCRGLDAACLPV